MKNIFIKVLMENLFIKNREGNKIALNLTKIKPQKGLVFVMPGLGQTKSAIHMQNFVDSFADKNFTVVIFDVTNGVGQSDGDYSQASFTGYYNDLADVIDWAKTQDWYQEPFVLAGHSMGGGCILRYAADYLARVSGIVPFATVIGGHQTIAKFGRDDLPAIKIENGKEVIKKLDWEPFKEDILKYDIVPEADKFTMPILMMVGEEDMGTPLEDQMKLYDGMPEDKEIHVVKGAPHTFEKPEHLAKMKQILQDWIDNKLKN
ncbi:MAG: alpha/beta fold hydrolase [Candidatus Komeilibacteria bacterium]|jgi:pimeloyl-ACP methyl ester carboxylesterase|nr:alpha/beta fold hydrolase [Candidatus Komeilibacteria bacterium]MBT4447826.1 alpha/beta fold hydrolase [Candidatus Komeilibacteria bacterium]